MVNYNTYYSLYNVATFCLGIIWLLISTDLNSSHFSITFFHALYVYILHANIYIYLFESYYPLLLLLLIAFLTFRISVIHLILFLMGNGFVRRKIHKICTNSHVQIEKEKKSHYHIEYMFLKMDSDILNIFRWMCSMWVRFIIVFIQHHLENFCQWCVPCNGNMCCNLMVKGKTSRNDFGALCCWIGSQVKWW